MSKLCSFQTLLLFIFLTFSGSTFYGQELKIIDTYFSLGADSLGTVDLSNCAIQLEESFTEIPDFGFLRSDFTYSKDGEMIFLVNENTSNNGLYDYCVYALGTDLQEVSQIGCFPTVGASHITQASDGTFYISATSLKHLDPASGVTVDLGFVGINGQALSYISALTFLDGELYAQGFDPLSWPETNKIVKVNLDDLLNSSPIFSFDFFESNFNDLESVNLGCDSSFIYGVKVFDDPKRDSVYVIDVENLSITAVCQLDYLTHIASPSAHHTFDCIPTLDLNQSASGLDDHSATACPENGNAIPIFSDSDPVVLTNTIMDSIWVGITGGKLNGLAEILECDAAILQCYSVDGELTLRNIQKLPNEEWVVKIQQAVNYKNSAVTVSEGIREISVVPFHKDYAGDTAILWLPIYTNKSTESQVFLCDGDSIYFHGDFITEAGIYVAKFESANGCDSLVTSHVSFLPNLSESIDTAIWVGDEILGIPIFSDTTLVQNLLDTNGCTYTLHYNVEIIVNTFQQNEKSELNIFPNPNNGEFFIELNAYNSEKITATIFDIFGNKKMIILNNHFVNNYFRKKINISELPSGIYFLEIKGNNWSEIKKVNVE